MNQYLQKVDPVGLFVHKHFVNHVDESDEDRGKDHALETPVRLVLIQPDLDANPAYLTTLHDLLPNPNQLETRNACPIIRGRVLLLMGE